MKQRVEILGRLVKQRVELYRSHMERGVSQKLDHWLTRKERRPLVLRGARQVGKTWLIRDLALRLGRSLVEINFERDPQLSRCFAANDPKRVLAELSLAMDCDITPDGSLLFLDEIQAVPEMFARLRWFAEELAVLPVAAAGSLLNFTLADKSFRVPVGRIGYLHVEPMGYQEYLRAHGQDRLIDALKAWHPGGELSTVAQARATEWFDRYAMVGGMPDVVAADIAQQDPQICRALQRQLVATFRDDFAKYSGRMDRNILDSTLTAVASSLGRKFVYAHVEQGVKQHQAKHALELLAQARLCHIVRHAAANGLPLAGEIKDTFRKAILLDVGLLHALLATPAARAFPSWDSLSASVKGQLTEQLAGQELRLLDSASGDEPTLYYWQRNGGRPGEIDYLLQIAARIVPVEVKAGAGGAMKSLHQFMFDKQLDLAVRFDRNPPSLAELSVKTTQGDSVRYRLVSLPLYLAWRLPEIMDVLAFGAPTPNAAL